MGDLQPEVLLIIQKIKASLKIIQKEAEETQNIWMH